MPTWPTAVFLEPLEPTAWEIVLFLSHCRGVFWKPARSFIGIFLFGILRGRERVFIIT